MADETFTWALWRTGASAIFTFLYVLSISIGFVAGNYIMNPWVVAALAFLIPYFSYWLLPFLIIMFRAISNTNLIV